MAFKLLTMNCLRDNVSGDQDTHSGIHSYIYIYIYLYVFICLAHTCMHIFYVYTHTHTRIRITVDTHPVHVHTMCAHLPCSSYLHVCVGHRERFHK